MLFSVPCSVFEGKITRSFSFVGNIIIGAFNIPLFLTIPSRCTDCELNRFGIISLLLFSSKKGDPDEPGTTRPLSY